VATYKILYWQEIPSQIKAEDESDDVTLPLDPRFMERIDQLAAQRGLQGADDYLSHWRWSDEGQAVGCGLVALPPRDPPWGRRRAPVNGRRAGAAWGERIPGP